MLAFYIKKKFYFVENIKFRVSKFQGDFFIDYTFFIHKSFSILMVICLKKYLHNQHLEIKDESLTRAFAKVKNPILFLIENIFFPIH